VARARAFQWQKRRGNHLPQMLPRKGGGRCPSTREGVVSIQLIEDQNSSTMKGVTATILFQNLVGVIIPHQIFFSLILINTTTGTGFSATKLSAR